MRINDIIAKKRDGFGLSKEEIEFWVRGVTDDAIPDYQSAALLMAIYLNGMTDEEAVYLTFAIRDSGGVLKLDDIDGYKVDKHSTGGVGDKTSLIVVPLIASLGIKVAKMSGRGLGHTGGTVDKLESITGYQTEMNRKEFFEIVKAVGCGIIGQNIRLAPADKKLYALRDVTETVANRALIASSIMGKKLASGANGIVLDVKYGNGSFNRDLETATALGELMRSIGKMGGVDVAVVYSDMNVPLGNAIGNSLEVIEACEVLKGRGPKDLIEECVRLAKAMYGLAYPTSVDSGESKIRTNLKNGAAFLKFKEMCRALGGDVALLDDYDLFKQPKYKKEIFSTRGGKITACDTAKYGYAALVLGAGRWSKEQTVDPSAGIVLDKKVGDDISVGDRLATLYGDNIDSFTEAEQILWQATDIESANL